MLSTRYFIFIVIAIVASVESSTSSFRSNDAFLRGMLTPDSQYMYISACRSNERVECIARGGSGETEHQDRPRRGRASSEDVTPMQAVGKARDAAATFAVRIQRHAFTHMPRQRVEDNKNGIN
ncbi:hypothetical protein ACHAWO_003643 [Cyclotella atomus]|uniref:Uncharacterized protein n=1 Tax=Cyclotella atomus TaxID=382360 RepID=A0ABD3N959_9STRA